MKSTFYSKLGVFKIMENEKEETSEDNEINPEDIFDFEV